MLCWHYTIRASHSQWPKVLCVINFLLLQLSNSFLRILAVPNKAVFSNSPVLIVTPSFSSHASYLLLTTPSAPTTTGTTSSCLIPHSLPISDISQSFHLPFHTLCGPRLKLCPLWLPCYFPSQQQQEQALIISSFAMQQQTYKSISVRKHHTYKGHTKFTKSSRWAGIRTFPVSTKLYSWILFKHQKRSKPSCNPPRFTQCYFRVLSGQS